MVEIRPQLAADIAESQGTSTAHPHDIAELKRLGDSERPQVLGQIAAALEPQEDAPGPQSASPDTVLDMSTVSPEVAAVFAKIQNHLDVSETEVLRVFRSVGWNDLQGIHNLKLLANKEATMSKTMSNKRTKDLKIGVVTIKNARLIKIILDTRKAKKEKPWKDGSPSDDFEAGPGRHNADVELDPDRY